MDKVCGLVLTIEPEHKRSFEDDESASVSRSVRAKVSSPQAKTNFESRAARMTQVHHKYDLNNPLSYEHESTPADVDGDDFMQKIDFEALTF
ncbi:hypothetical protein DFQ28_001647 [Apophysomyces sp. BC1034]|nr:hypothetical protein DFQ28_001647 [Apophysomyces sp. BC1034]